MLPQVLSQAAIGCLCRCNMVRVLLPGVQDPSNQSLLHGCQHDASGDHIGWWLHE
jgi:hypothetical protein